MSYKIGDKIQKPLETEENIQAYMAAAVWCNETGNVIIDKGEYYEICHMAKTFEELKELKWSEIKFERDRLEQAGVPYLDKTLDSDTVSVQRIAIAVQAAQAAIATEQSFTLAWTMQDNTAVTMDAAQVVGMSVALAMYSDSLHQTARALREKIEAAETVEDLAIIMWPK